MDYPPKPSEMSEAAWRYLWDLRTMPFDEFRLKYENNLNRYQKR